MIDYYSASFRGVSFAVRAHSMHVQRAVIEKSIPYANHTYKQDLGMASQTIHIVAFIWGDDVIEHAHALEAALQQSGSGELCHPLYNTHDVYITSYTVEQDFSSDNNCISITITALYADERDAQLQTTYTETDTQTQQEMMQSATHIEDIARANAHESITQHNANTPQIAAPQKDLAYTTAIQSIAQENTNMPTFSLANAQLFITHTRTMIYNASILIRMSSADISELMDTIERAYKQITDPISELLQIITIYVQLGQCIQKHINESNNPRDMLIALQQYLYIINEQIRTVMTKPSARNQAGISISLAYASLAIAHAHYTNQNDAHAMRAAIIAQFETVLPSIQYTLYDALMMHKSIFLRIMKTKDTQLKPIQYQAMHDMHAPLLVLCHEHTITHLISDIANPFFPQEQGVIQYVS